MKQRLPALSFAKLRTNMRSQKGAPWQHYFAESTFTSDNKQSAIATRLTVSGFIAKILSGKKIDGSWSSLGGQAEQLADESGLTFRITLRHGTLPFRIIFIASILRRVRHAVRNDPYPLASHTRCFTVL
jgi:hypothetical protein